MLGIERNGEVLAELWHEIFSRVQRLEEAHITNYREREAALLMHSRVVGLLWKIKQERNIK